MSAKQPIVIKGAKTHNLKNIDVTIPRNQLIVVTGVSGSGKSSLVFDTLYAEGHRRYVESLSSYARQFVARMQKPPVEYITGISPAIAIEQRVHTSNPRSTVGSITEIYDYLRLLFARIGRTFSPASGEEVRCQTVTDVVDFILQTPAGAKIYLLAPLINYNRPIEKELEIAIQKGFSRLYYRNEVQEIQELLEKPKALMALKWEEMYLLIDRLVNQDIDENYQHRIADSIQTAFNEGNGSCYLIVNDQPLLPFSEAFERDGIKFEKPTEQLFNFNNPIGACQTCEGSGKVTGYDEDLLIPNKTLSLEEQVVALWKHVGLTNYQSNFVKNAPKFGFDINKPYYALSKDELKLLWQGNPDIWGIYGTIEAIEKDIAARRNIDTYRSILFKYRGTSECKDCQGSRIRREALYVKVNDYSIADILKMSIEELYQVFQTFTFDETDHKIADRIIREIQNRLSYLVEVGLGYLNLSRKASTLSGGETQRINLATSLGSNLTGSLYILDEPSIGLHPRDTDRLITILETLRNLGNTVIVVEHDESVMHRANHLIDVGPLAGEQGGQIVFSGNYQEIIKHPDSLTGKYLSDREKIPLPEKVREPQHFFSIKEAAEHNLKGISVEIPFNCFTVVTGVSGSGKTTLIKSIFYPLLKKEVHGASEKPGLHKSFRMPPVKVGGVELVDQNAMTTGIRSTPVSYIGAYEHIRTEFAALPDAKASYFNSGMFSYNVPGGRCEACEGDGIVRISMQFMPDIELVCETCGGKRFREPILDIKFRGKNISEVLDMSISEGLDFFADKRKITDRLGALVNVGLGYVRLGQSTGTLSGGEAQRLKLAYFLQETDRTQQVYIFDEPTTGLHSHDVKKLIQIFRNLVERGHTVVVIEHNLELIKCADWAIDLGPEGGVRGGHLLFSGTPRDLAKCADSYTGLYLKPMFD